MILKFDERPYAGRTFRPRPEIHLDPATKLLIIATPWGPRTSARKAIDRMVEYLSLAREDDEATSPFERLTCLSTQANNLRVAAMLANDAIYREDNRDEYRSGVELFAAQVTDNEVDWIQCGNPQILLGRHGRTVMPVGSQLDLSSDLSSENAFLPALPSQLLGLDLSLNLNVNSFRARAGDRLVLLSHSQPPESVYTLKEDAIAIDSLSRDLAKSHPDLAFWLGILTIESETGQNEVDPVDEAFVDTEEEAS